MKIDQNKIVLRIFFKNHVAVFFGFILGIKVCDFLFYDENKFNLVKELTEEQFWINNGEPLKLKPDYVPSFKQNNDNDLRKTYIKINYEKDMYVPKIKK